jgi:excisionase family DNA binding protein
MPLIAERERLLIRVSEAADRLAISRSRAYELAQEGRLPGQVRLAGSIRVSLPALQAWIDGQVREGEPPSAA